MSYSATVKAQIDDRIARIKGAEGTETLRTNMIVRYWEHISPEHVESCVGYLKEYTSTKNADTASLSVSGLVVDKTTLSGYWRGGKVTVKRDDEEKKSGMYTIYQELHEGFITTTKASSAFVFTDWILVSGDLYTSGASQITLRLPNVSPAYVENIRAELQASASFSSPTCKYESLSGTFYYIDARIRLEDDGSYSIDLALARMSTASPLYTVTSKKLSEESNEEVRLYEDIPVGYITTLVNSLATLGSYTIVDVDARKTSDAGIFDVYLTLKSATTIASITSGKNTDDAFVTTKTIYRNQTAAQAEGLIATAQSAGTVVDTDLRKTGQEGIFDVEIATRVSRTLSDIDSGRTEDDISTTTRTLYRNKTTAEITTLVTTAQVAGTVVDTDVKKTPIEGIFDVELIVRTAKVLSGYTVVGGRTTAFMSEEKRMYRNILIAGVAELVGRLVETEGYTLVDCDTQSTGIPGVYNVYVTLRKMITPPGGTEILIGVTGGLFRTEVYMIRNVSDIYVESTIRGLTDMALIDDIRATRSSNDGYWDVIYSVLILPNGHTEYRITEEMKQAEWYEVSSVQQHMVYDRCVIGDLLADEPTKAYYGYMRIFPQSYSYHAKNQKRTARITRTVTYSSSEPSSPTFGEVTRLSNGIFVKVEESYNIPWWD